MKTIEVEGKTIDEAIENACHEFNVPREKLNIEIISEGTTGFLGIGSKKAVIKASMMNFDMAFDDHEKQSRTANKPAEKQTAVKKQFTPKPLQEKPLQEKPLQEKPAEPVTAHEKQDTGTSCEQTAIRARELLEGILQRMDIPGSVSYKEKDESITLNIEGDGDGLLIGKRGQNLDAIQYIVNKATNRSENGRKPIIIDSGTYRKRREESLLSLAAKLGDKVKRTKKSVTVSNMNAHDRRIIHMALQNDTTLVTKSRGEGEYRKIVIMLSKPSRPARTSKKSQ